MQDVITTFKRHFSYPPVHVVRVPSVVVLLGNPADHLKGMVVCAAVNKYTSLASAPRLDGKIELVRQDGKGRELFWMSELKRNPNTPWADPIKAVLHQLRKRGANFTGFNAAVHAELAPGTRGSGSASLEVAIALSIRQLHPFRLTETGTTIPPKRTPTGELPSLDSTERLCLARLCQDAEHQFLGTQPEALASLGSLFAKAWHVLSVDLRFLTVERSSMVGEVIILCATDAATTSVKLKNDELQEACESVTRKLGAKALRSIELRFLEANKAKLTPREYEVARHVLGDMQRVVFAERALNDEDHRQFGQYMFQGHESARTLLRNTQPQMDLLIDLARAHPGCLGARPSDGATVNLVAYHQAEAFIQDVSQRYQAQEGAALQTTVCQMVDGVG